MAFLNSGDGPFEDGCRTTVEYEYGQGERSYYQCGTVLENPHEVVLCDECRAEQK
jgi:hypothetical protein